MPKLTKADFVALGIMTALFLARCVFLGHGYMWFNEILCFDLIHDPSTSHMVSALGDQVDAVPPLYYLAARAWAAVFSGDPMWLRMFSTVGFCVGFWLLWATMRQCFAFFPALMAMAMVTFCDPTIDYQCLNIRFYGLLFMLVCLAVFLACKICGTARAGWSLLAANALTQAALVLCDPLGGAYGALIMCGVAASDLLSGPVRLRPAVLASYVAGWLGILPWLKPFLHQAEINQPHSWIPVPTIGDLTSSLREKTEFYPLLLLFPVLLLFSNLPKLESHPLPAAPNGPPSDGAGVQRSQLWIALGLITLAPLFWVMSRLFPTNSIFLPRYLMVTAIGWTIVCAFLVELICERIVFCKPMVMTVAGLLILAASLKPVYAPLASRLAGKPMPEERAFLAGKSDCLFGHPGLPIVCPAVNEFTVRRRYAADPERYFFLLNWQASIAPEAPQAASVEYKLISAMKRNSYESKNVMEAAEFLAKNDAFLLLNIPDTHWCSLFLKPGQYKITPLEPTHPLLYDHKGEWPMLLVEKNP